MEISADRARLAAAQACNLITRRIRLHSDRSDDLILQILLWMCHAGIKALKDFPILVIAVGIERILILADQRVIAVEFLYGRDEARKHLEHIDELLSEIHILGEEMEMGGVVDIVEDGLAPFPELLIGDAKLHGESHDVILLVRCIFELDVPLLLFRQGMQHGINHHMVGFMTEDAEQIFPHIVIFAGDILQEELELRYLLFPAGRLVEEIAEQLLGNLLGQPWFLILHRLAYPQRLKGSA